jgi:RimJ/RimL family protein N-acetyltransferase
MREAWPVPAGLSFPDPPLRRDPVLLRPWNCRDVPAVVAACQDLAISRWSPSIPRPYAERDAVNWLEHQRAARLAGTSLSLAVVHTGSGQLLGAVALSNVNLTQASARTGYWLVAQARGHGYMTQAVLALAGWAFDQLGLARLDLVTDPDNVASQRVAERCGFQPEGRLGSHLRIRHTGERRDSLLYRGRRGSRRPGLSVRAGSPRPARLRTPRTAPPALTRGRLRLPAPVAGPAAPGPRQRNVGLRPASLSGQLARNGTTAARNSSAATLWM